MITGSADQLEVRRKQNPIRAHVGPKTKFDVVAICTQAKQVLVTSGWKLPIANAAVAAAYADLGSNTTLEKLIFEAFRRCLRE